MTVRQRSWLLPPAALALVVGVFPGRYAAGILLPLFACILVLFAVILLKGWFRFTACIAFSFVLGILAGSVAFHPTLPQEGQYKVQGVISDEVTTGSFGQYRIALSDVHLDGRPFAGGAYWTFYSDIEHSELIPGKSVSFQASLYHPRGAENPDGYNFRESLLQRGILIGLYGKDEFTVQDPEKFSLPGFFASLRHRLSDAMIRSLGNETGSYASALLLGMRSLIPSEDRQAFSRLGIAHILSVSGFHVGVLIGILNLLFHLLKLRQGVRLAFYGILLFFYASLCGMSQPVIRASLLMVLGLEGRILNRPRSGLHLLSAALFIMVLLSPVQVTSASFQLTFCAVLGLVWFTPFLRRQQFVRGRILRSVFESLILTFGIQLGLLLPELAFEFSGSEQIMHYLSQINVDTLPDLESEIEVDAYNAVSSECLYFIFFLERDISGVNTYYPVCVSTLRLFVKYRIQYVSVDLLEVFSLCKIYKVIAAERKGFIFLKIVYSTQIVSHVEHGLLHALDLCTSVPADHYKQYGQGQKNCYISSGSKFAKA